MIGSGEYCLSHRNFLDELSNIEVPLYRFNSLRILLVLKILKGHCADFSFPTECCVGHTHVKRKRGRFLFKVSLTIIRKSRLKVSQCKEKCHLLYHTGPDWLKLYI